MNTTWKLMAFYLIIIFLILMSSMAYGQKICKKDICVVEFNAGWNDKNSVKFLDSVTDCGIKRINIDEGDWQEKYNIAIVPTVIVFNGKEVKRFQADISFQLAAKLEDVQEVVDEIIMSKF
jgi:hypothetical protein